MSEVSHLTNNQAIIIAQWAELHKGRLRAVLLYGSRFTGYRREKQNSNTISDIDLAVSIEGSNAEERGRFFNHNRIAWSTQLSELLGGVPVQFMSADPEFGPLVTGFLLDDGYKILWHDPDRWSADMIRG